MRLAAPAENMRSYSWLYFPSSCSCDQVQLLGFPLMGRGYHANSGPSPLETRNVRGTADVAPSSALGTKPPSASDMTRDVTVLWER
jgi:hypothetical protein